MKQKKRLSLKAKLALSQMAMNLIPTQSICFFRDNADLFELDGGVSLSYVAERYGLGLKTVYEHVSRLVRSGCVIKIRPGWYGLASQLPDRDLNLVLMEYEAYGEPHPM